LQEPLAVALGVLEEVETFRQSLVRLDVLRVRGVGCLAATSCALWSLQKKVVAAGTSFGVDGLLDR